MSIVSFWMFNLDVCVYVIIAHQFSAAVNASIPKNVAVSLNGASELACRHLQPGGNTSLFFF